MNPRARRARHILRARRTGLTITGGRTTFLYRKDGSPHRLPRPLTRGYLQEEEGEPFIQPMTGYDLFLINEYGKYGGGQ
jgi:hypothetical protein